MLISMRFILFFVCAIGLMGCPSAENSQAVQNMNLLFGLDEREGLRLKASAF